MRYIDLETARTAIGLRLVVVAGFPSPWSEAAKGLFYAKGIDFAAVRFRIGDNAVPEFTGVPNAPVAIYNAEPPRSHWADILMLAERIDARVSLLPNDADTRALMIGTSHEICGEGGLGWCTRLLLIHKSLSSDESQGFPAPVATHLARRYGYAPDLVAPARARVNTLLQQLASRLRHAHDRGHTYLFTAQLSAADIYMAAFLGLLAPLSDEFMPVSPRIRRMVEALTPDGDLHVPPELIAHRDFIYHNHLELPIEL